MFGVSEIMPYVCKNFKSILFQNMGSNMKRLFQLIAVLVLMLPNGLAFGQSCVGTATFNVSINAAPTATITNGASALYCSGGGIYLTAQTGTGYGYQWYRNGIAITGATSWSYLATTAGSYTVQVSNAGGCAIYSTATAVSQTATSCGVVAQIKLLLEGPYLVGSGNMNTGLRTAGLLPRTQPFNVSPWNYMGSESLPQISDLPANTVDWVLVELRNASNTIVASRAALLQNNGNVVDVDGSNGVRFSGVSSGSYNIVVRSRNHMAVMSLVAVSLPNTSQYDFTVASNVSGGADQLKSLATGVYGLRAGDFNADGVISLVDFNTWIGTGALPVNQYSNRDISYEGQVTVGDFDLYRPNASSIGIPAIRY